MALSFEATERELAAAAIAGDDLAFQRLYETLAGRVFNLVLRAVHERATAEDICQDVWLKAHREINRLQAPAAVRTWLFRMASRACIDYSRSRAHRERQSPELSDEMLVAADRGPEAAALKQSDLRAMWETLAAMPPRQSVALYLKQVDGYSYDEIGRILGCPRSAVETLLFRARQSFARLHGELESDPARSCKMIGRAMAVVLDNEGTPLQERAVRAHVADCKACRAHLDGLRNGNGAYLGLPLLPAGGEAIASALASGSGGGGLALQAARLLDLLIVKVKAGATAAIVAGAVGTTAVAAGTVSGVLPQAPDLFGLGGRSASVSVPAPVEVPFAAPIIAPGEMPLPPSEAALQMEDVPYGGPAAEAQAPAAPLDPEATAVPPVGGPDSDGGLAGLADSTVEGLGGTLGNTVDSLSGVLDDTLRGVTGTLEGAVEDPAGTVTGVLDDPVGTVNDTTDTVTEGLDGGTGLVEDTVDDITGGLEDTLDAPLELPSLEGPAEVVEDDGDDGCVLGLLGC